MCLNYFFHFSLNLFILNIYYYWTKLEKIHYANTKENAANIGFVDQFIYDEFKKRKNPYENLNDRT